MKKNLAPALALALLLFPATARAADPVVSNLPADQRAGTTFLDITYDVTADAPTVHVSLEISSDGGTTFSVPATTESGGDQFRKQQCSRALITALDSLYGSSRKAIQQKLATIGNQQPQANRHE